MENDPEIKAEMEKVLRRRNRICPNSLAADVLVKAISPKFPDMDAFQLSVAVFRLSGRQPFKRKITNDEIVVCLANGPS